MSENGHKTIELAGNVTRTRPGYSHINQPNTGNKDSHGQWRNGQYQSAS